MRNYWGIPNEFITDRSKAKIDHTMFLYITVHDCYVKIDWGDGASDIYGMSGSISHFYQDSGKYLITIYGPNEKLTKDNDGIKWAVQVNGNCDGNTEGFQPLYKYSPYKCSSNRVWVGNFDFQ